MELQAATALRPAMEPGEQLLWCGSPHCLWRRRELLTGFISLVVTGLLAFAAYAGEAGLFIFAPFSSGAFLTSIVVPMYVRTRSSYGVTDRHVLLVRRGIRPRVEAYALRGMTEKNVILAIGDDGIGSIKFADFAQRCGYNDRDLCMPEFVLVSDADHVTRLIRRAISAAAPAPVSRNPHGSASVRAT